jgi:hypothetical protein
MKLNYLSVFQNKEWSCGLMVYKISTVIGRDVL